MKKSVSDITRLVGGTPMLDLTPWAAERGCRSRLLAKLELCNPSGSVKDRPVLYLLRDALERGLVRKGGVVIEPSGGNTALSVAMLSAALGLRAVIVLPDSVSPARQRRMEAFGAELIPFPAADGSEGRDRIVRKLTEKLPDACLLRQFDNDVCCQAHRETTAKEILAQCGSVDFFVAGVGTGATITGCGEVLRMDNPDCRVIAVEPVDSPVLSGGFPGAHALTGIGPGFIPEILNTYLLDEVIKVRTPDSLALCRDMARRFGLLCGPSSGAALSAALSVAAREEAAGKTVVTLLPDGGLA